MHAERLLSSSSRPSVAPASSVFSPFVEAHFSTPSRSLSFPLSFCVPSCLSVSHQSILTLCFPQNTALPPAIFFLRASSLSVACDIRGLTELQPVARRRYCLTVWAKSPVSLGGGQAERDHLAPVALCWDAAQGHEVNMRDEDEERES